MPHAANTAGLEPFWPPGVPHQIAVPDESLWLGLERRAASDPDATALDFLGNTWTWATLRREAERLAGALQGLGVERGDRVLLFSQNAPQFVIAFHAVLRAGAVVVPVNPMNKADELGHYIVDAQARVAIAAADIAGELASASRGCAQGLKHLVLFEMADALPADLTGAQSHWPAPWQAWLSTRHPMPDAGAAKVHRWTALVEQAHMPSPLLAQGDDLALLPYTSGTTGSSKGCMHTHASLLHNALAVGKWNDMRPGDTHLLVAPLFHITGLVVGMLASIWSGGRIVLLPRWDRRVAAHAISTHRVTHWANIPTMVIDLLSGTDLDQYDLGSLRYIGGGGAAMPDAVGAHLKERFGLDYVEGYGLTETAAPTHSNPMTAPRLRCLGIPFVGTEARVVDPLTLATLPVGEAGEILVRGPQLFKGYWGNPTATRDAFVEIDGTQFFRTGDLGHVDADGYYYLTDRLKRMINASGFKVWPAEVEAMLHRHPAIRECCVIASRDPYRGESVKAIVVLHETQRGQVSEAEIVDWARERMAAYKYPREIEFAEDLPRTASGKVLWRQAQARQDTLDAARA